MIYSKDSELLYEKLVNKIENEIATGVLKKGDKLPSENTLAKENEISRVTVRQALKLLAEMGLIQTKKGIGSFVAVESDRKVINDTVEKFVQKFEDNFKQAMRVKIMIEPRLMQTVAEVATEEEISNLEKLWSQVTVNTNKKVYNEICVEFHLGLIKCIKNPLLLEFYEKLEEMEKMYLHDLLLPKDMSRLMRQNDIEQHGKILNAIKNRKGDMAYLYCLEHLNCFYEFYSSLQKNQK